MINVQKITKLHREMVARWHDEPIDNRYDKFLAAVCDQHEQNFRLWHKEDIARSPDATDSTLGEVKRAIDKLNQRRNDLIEHLDLLLIEMLGKAKVEPTAEARLNTETPGSAIDRLSILSLRLFHMHEQMDREGADDSHRATVSEKLDVLYRQHDDLSKSLTELLDDIFAGRKLLKVYRQMKMYNDPTMNPYIYDSKNRPAA